MYLDDPREQQIDINNHTVWEEDNRKEIRYQWGAAIWDLCNMDPKDYGETIFITRLAGSELIKNTLNATIEGTSMNITFPYSPISDIYIVIKDSDEKKEVIVLSKGSTSPFLYTLTGVTASKISSLCIGPTEDQALTPMFSDDTYEYRIVKRINVDILGKFAVVPHSIFEEGITESKLRPYLNSAVFDENETSFEYNIPSKEVEGLNDMTDEEYEITKKKYANDLLFFSTTSSSNFYVGGEYDQTDLWERNYQTIQLEGTTYKVSHFKNTMVNLYDPDFSSPRIVAIKYKITAEKTN